MCGHNRQTSLMWEVRQEVWGVGQTPVGFLEELLL